MNTSGNLGQLVLDPGSGNSFLFLAFFQCQPEPPASA